MTQARQFVVDALRAHQGLRATVLPFAKTLDKIIAPVVMVRMDGVQPSEQPQAWWTFTFAVIAVVPITAPGAADERVDHLALEVIYALEKSDLPRWTTAQRATFQDSYPAFEITLTIDVTKEND